MESLWMKNTEFSPRRVLTDEIRTDAVVIGGGLAGILTAFFLKERGISTIVLEAKTIGSGQTGRTTAKVTSQHGLIYSRMISEWGQKKAKQYADANQWAIREYECIIRKRQINCDWKRDDAFLYSFHNHKALEKEAHAAKTLGLPATLEAPSVKGESLNKNAPLLLRFRNQASFQPLTFLNDLAKELTIYENSPVLTVHGHKVHTQYGTVIADHIIFACHYPFINFPGFFFTKLHQERSYLLALRHAPIPPGMYLGIDTGGYTFRSHEDITLFGGSNHRTGQSSHKNPYEHLIETAHDLWPDCELITAWSAQDCMTLDQIPVIGPYSLWRPYWYVASGFEKWGMTSSMVAARLLSDQICNIYNPWADIFHPHRKLTPSAWKALFHEAGITAINWIRGIVSSRRCPHMGCRLKWNRSERTWECPCHGSRFDQNGSLLDNPAQTDIKQ